MSSPSPSSSEPSSSPSDISASTSTSDTPSSTSDMASTSSSTSDMSQTSTTSSPTPSPTSLPPTTTTTTTTTTTPPSTTTTTTSEPPPTTTSTSTTTSSDTPPTTTTTTSTSDPTPISSDPPTTTSTTTVLSPSSSLSPAPPPPPTTTQFTPTTTFQSVVFVSITDGRGSPTSTAPPKITSTFTSVGTDGGLVTVTQVVANPSLIPNDSHAKDSGFFGNTGAVAAVFVLVGLAITSIAIWTIFAIRRRRRQSRIEHQTADAALHAAATHRPPLEDDDDPQQHFSPLALQMSRQRSSPGMASTSLGPRKSYHDDPDQPDPYNPYAEFGHIPLGPVPTNTSNGYSIARTNSPPNAHFNNDRSQRASAAVSLASANGLDGYAMGTHSTTPSGASIEPLLSSHRRQSTGSGQLPGPPVIATAPTTAMLPRTPPIGYSQLLVDALGPLEVRSAFTTDDRLDPGLQQRQREAESASMKDLRDDEDYSRPVLGVRNLP